MERNDETLAGDGCESTMARSVAYGSQQYGGPGDCNIMFRITFAWAQQSKGMGLHRLKHPNLCLLQLEHLVLTQISEPT